MAADPQPQLSTVRRWEHVTLEPDERLIHTFTESPDGQGYLALGLGVLFGIAGFWWSWLWWSLPLLVVYALWTRFVRLNNRFAITNKRFLARTGVFDKTATQIRRNKITDVTAKRPFLNDDLKEGEVYIRTAGSKSPAVVIRYLPNPDEIADLIRGDT